MRLRATMTVEVEYEMDTALYIDIDPRKIVDMEREAYDKDPAGLLGREGAQHWIDVENITHATTDQQVDQTMKIYLVRSEHGYLHIRHNHLVTWVPKDKATVFNTPDDAGDAGDFAFDFVGDLYTIVEFTCYESDQGSNQEKNSEPPRRAGELAPDEEVTFGGQIRKTGIKRGPNRGIQPMK